MTSETGRVLFTFGDFRSWIQLAPLSHLYIFSIFPERMISVIEILRLTSPL